MYPNIVKAIHDKDNLKQLSFKASPYTVTLRLNNTKQFISITNGITTQAIYGKISLTGKPLFKVNTPQAIKDKLDSLEQYNLAKLIQPVPSCDCRICGKPLTNPASIDLGIGPECALNDDSYDLEDEED